MYIAPVYIVPVYIVHSYTYCTSRVIVQCTGFFYDAATAVKQVFFYSVKLRINKNVVRKSVSLSPNIYSSQLFLIFRPYLIF